MVNMPGISSEDVIKAASGMWFRHETLYDIFLKELNISLVDEVERREITKYKV